LTPLFSGHFLRRAGGGVAEADRGAGGEAGRQLEDAPFAAGAGEAAAGEGGDGGVPVDVAIRVPPLVPQVMNRVVKSPRWRNVPLLISSSVPASSG